MEKPRQAVKPSKQTTKKTSPRGKQSQSNIFAKSALRSKFRFNKIFAIGVATLIAATGAYLLMLSRGEGTYRPQGTYTDWQWSTYPDHVHSTLDGFITIENDPTKAHPAHGYYWANQFWVGGDGGYMGIQTNGEAGSYTGKVAIFALWTGIEAQPGQADGHCSVEKAGFDGGDANGATCRIPLPWNSGDKYRLRLTTTASDASGRTWTSTIRNEATGQEQTIGSIKVPSQRLIQGALGNWTEYYSQSMESCEIPYSKVTFGTPLVDGKALPNYKASHINEGPCLSKITEVPGGVRQEQGDPFVGPTPPLPPGGTHLTDLNWTSATTGYGDIKKDQRVAGTGPIILASGQTYDRGIGTHAISDIRYALDNKYTRFVGYVNIQQGASGRVNYEVWADGARLFNSGPMDGMALTKAVNVDVTGKKELTLIVGDGGDGNGADWAAWADVRLLTYTPLPTSSTSQATIQNSLSGRCLDTTNARLVNGSQVQIADCTGKSSQKWRASGYSLWLASSKCLTVNNSTNAGTPVVIWDCNGTPQQKWQVRSDGSLYSVYGGQCLDVLNSNSTAGAKLIIWDCHGGPNQRFSGAIGNGGGALKVFASNTKCVESPNYNTGNQTQLGIYNCHGGTNQQFQMEGDRIRLYHNKCLDVPGNKDAGTPLVIHDCHGDVNQQWKLRNDGSLYSAYANKCVDIRNGKNALFAKLILWNCNGSTSQRWTR